MLTRTTHVLAASLLCLSFALPATAQLPSRGMSMDTVRSQFGAPVEQIRPVGNPPITRWVYDDFTVYFEGRYALHAVRHRQAPAVPAGDTAPRPAAQPAAPAPEQPAPSKSETRFRFDPVTGRVIELDEHGNPLAPPTASPGAEARPEPVQRPARPEPAPQPAADTPPANDDGAMRFNPVTGQFEPVGGAPGPQPEQAPAQPKEPARKAASAPAKPAQPAATETAPAEDAGALRFNPVTGQFEPAGGAPDPQPEQVPTQPEKPARQASAPAKPAQPAAAREDGTADDDSRPAGDSGEPQFRFDPVTGRIIMDGAPSPTAN